MKLLDFFPELKNFNEEIQPILESVFLETYRKRKKKCDKKKAVVSAKAEAMSEAVRLISEENLNRIKDKFKEVL